MNLKRLRAWRVFLYFALLIDAVGFVLDAPAGSPFIVVTIIMMASLGVCVRVQNRTIRRQIERNRPRPDYASIARMEREVYGEAFEHEGAPVFTLTFDRGGVSMSEMGGREERATGRMRPCIGCGSREVRVGGKCPACYQRAKRDHGTARPTEITGGQS